MRRHSKGQLHLALRSDDTDVWMSCKGIFSLNYLRQHVVKTDLVPAAEQARSSYETIKALWFDNREGLIRMSERYTCQKFLEPLLRELGWSLIPEASLPFGQFTKKRPDYCLFADEAVQKEAAAQTDPSAVYSRASTVLEAKRANHLLDQISTRETPGLFPSQQIQDYLRNAKDAHGNRFFNWAILTNGMEWRLYCENAGTDAYYAFHLTHGEDFCSLDDFRLFMALFRPDPFHQQPGLGCPLDDIRKESVHCQVELELRMRKRIFDVLEDLANGFRAHNQNRITVADYDDLYTTSLIFLYRLLFILYAESRGLLPAKATGTGANRKYHHNFSLAFLVDRLRQNTEFQDDAFENLYERLLKLFHLINGDRPDQNKACGVTRYNGGLFDSDAHRLIEKWRVGDKTLADVLRQLVFAHPPARRVSRQQQISTPEAIDYSTLEVRQLGDIYEGMLGAHLEEEKGHLVLKNEKGKNHREGIFYTPDWIVTFLVRETLQPLLDEAEALPDVQKALMAKSEEKRRDDSFAHAVLRLNIVDPAMGSGHFLVRATEWLAQKVFEHATTHRKTEQIVGKGEKRRSREDITRDGRIPVSPGLSQEQAEIAYWRRRVVEACIYGVDLNPMAVELTKLSLWLTCIATDEPLNFLDHHLRFGNSLLGVPTVRLRHAPLPQKEQSADTPFNIGNRLTNALKSVIEENVNIEESASTEMDLVKKKEERWKAVRHRLDPYQGTADIWMAILSGLPLDDFQYRKLALLEIAPSELSEEERNDALKLKKSLEDRLPDSKQRLAPFHWELEFPDVFFEADGRPRPEAFRGFDAVLGNPPYISTHTSSEESWRTALERHAGYLEDLYVHFTDLGFQLLRAGGNFGFIVSDTFFTLAGKMRMREMLQGHSLLYLGQCDPFEATVDAAIFVARKETPARGDHLVFVQARPRRSADGGITAPEISLPTLPPLAAIKWKEGATDLSRVGMQVAHDSHDCLRIHQAPVALYRMAHKRVFFEPRPATLRLFQRFNEPVKRLVKDWWDKIETSQKFAENAEAISEYHMTLKPGHITLVGLIAEGGQGMRTANNARFLAYLEGTPQADEIKARREAWTREWFADAEIRATFEEVLKQNGGNPRKPTADSAVWEASTETLKAKFNNDRLGFSKTDLYRIAPKTLLATREDFDFAWRRRKAELLPRWQRETTFSDFWQREGLFGKGKIPYRRLREAQDVSDADFCRLCIELQAWAAGQQQIGQKQVRDALGLGSSEDYSDPDDAPRIATIYNGLAANRIFVPFRKGDPEGNRWVDNEPLYIDWSKDSVAWLSAAPEARWQGHAFFLKAGVTWSLHANHVRVKARYQPPCVFDASGSRLTPEHKVLSPTVFLAILNSDVFSFYLKKFVKHNQDVEINDVRMMPIVVPHKNQDDRLEKLARTAIECKKLTYTGEMPPNETVAFIQHVAKELTQNAPLYLRPHPQQLLLTTSADGLTILELAVNWEAEKLYGVEGMGPFDEF